jgi:hypothetical protein
MDTSKLAQRLKALQEKSSGGKNIWFKASEEKQKIRMVPYPHNPIGPFIEVYFHYNVAGNRSLVCPKKTHGEACPICELAEEFRAMGTKDSWAMFKKLDSKLRTYSPVLVRGQDDAGVKLWGYGSTIFESLMEKFLDADWGDLSDPKTGRDLTVWSVGVGAAGNDTDFAKPKLDVSPNMTPTMAKKTDLIKILEELPDYKNDGESFPVRSYQELQDIVRKLSNVEEDDEPETKYAASTDDDDEDEIKTEKKSGIDEDDLNSKLNALLGK